MDWTVSKKERSERSPPEGGQPSDSEELVSELTRRLARALNLRHCSLILEAESEESAAGLLPEVAQALKTGQAVHAKGAGGELVSVWPISLRGKALGAWLMRAPAERAAWTAGEIGILEALSQATAMALGEKHKRLAAEKRAQQLQNYEAYFANISQGIALLDKKGQVLSVNPAGSQLLEMNSEEALRASENALWALLQSFGQREVRKEFDLEVQTPSGRRLTLAVCASPLEGSGGTTVISFRDVTLQRHLAGELRKTKDFLERLIDSSVDAIIAADMAGKIILFNKAAEAICGYSNDEAMGSLNARALYPPGVAAEIMARLRSSSEGGPGQLRSCRQEIVTKTGARIPVNLTASTVYEGGGEVATVGIFTDLRDRMQLERKLYDTQSRLEESERNAVAMALAGAAAHELNQPLTSVMGYAELIQVKLKQDRLEEEFASRSVEIIYRQAQRMAEIVKRMNQIKRYETKSYVGDSKILDLEKAASEDGQTEFGWNTDGTAGMKHDK